MNSLNSKMEHLTSPIARDLKLNFRKFAFDSSLTPEEVALLTLAIGKALDFPAIEEWAQEQLAEIGVPIDQVLEAEESAALMGMLNTYYKFRGFITEADPTIAENYGQAGLRMTALARPSLGKEKFELLALVVSLVNGCQTCVISHESVLRESGMAPAKIHDAVRLAATIKGFSKLKL
jgi:alkyl hydroperoxide reductase subunit D